MSVYPESMVAPIRAEFEGFPVVELRTPEVVKAFMEERGRKVVFINSVCGCAGSVSRPAFLKSFNHSILPQKAATIFAGVDVEAIEQYKTYLVGADYSSPSFLFLRDSRVVYHIPRSDIEGTDEKSFYEYLVSVYNRFMGEQVDESIRVLDPNSLYDVSLEKAKEMVEKEGFIFIDCRGEEERKKDKMFEDSIHLDGKLVEEMLETWSRKKKIVFYCSMGIRSRQAVLYFRQNGFSEAYNIAPPKA